MDTCRKTVTKHSGKWGAILVLSILLGTGFSGGDQPAETRPNILLIVADDLGYADLGVYGSDIQTPNIDQLAEEGVLFTQFHTAPMCAPTRAMLLSGNNNHIAGMGNQSPPRYMQAVPGHEGRLSDRIAPLPRLLKEAGYRTYLTGKWHLGLSEEHSPRAAGFERSYGLVDGAGNHYNAVGFFEGGSTFREDGELTSYPEGQYATEVYTDKLLEYIESGREDGRPFFALAAYTTPHWPLQVPEKDLNLYAGHYDQGYDQLREERFESLKNAGIISEASTLPPRNEAITPWKDLSLEEQKRESRKMELYAAMVHNLDEHVGRLVNYLKANGLYDNTLIVFMSDNGAAAEDFYNMGPFVEYIRSHYNNAYENMGHPHSWVSYGPQWAEAGSAPFSRHKGYAREGGIVAPMIIAGSKVALSGALNRSYITVMDLAPTFLDLAGAAYPSDDSVSPMLGKSMTALLEGSTEYVHDDGYVTLLYHRGNAFVRKGKWKLVMPDPPFAEEKFELFNIEEDPGEVDNLAGEEKVVFEELLQLWREKRLELGIFLPQDF